MDDLISRQAAIDALAKWFYEVFGIRESDGTATIFKRLRKLPTAGSEWLHDLLQDAIDDGIITEVQAVKIIERVSKYGVTSR